MPSPPPRLQALDVFRGMTVAGMLLVNNPGSWAAIYPPLEHAAWHGWTPTDLVFPFFLFIVGITTHLSRQARRARGDDPRGIRRQVLRRGLTIVAVGLALAAFPYVPLTRLTEVRIPGVLQRIGLAYLGGALLTMRGSLRRHAAVVAALLLGYWALMTLVPVPGYGRGAQLLDDPSASLAAYIDRAVFGSHLWKSSRTWDPEGLLSTLPAMATVILGTVAGGWLASARPLADRLVGLYGVGAVGTVLGLMWNWTFPINKSLWTSSYTVFTAGMAAMTLATCLWVVDGLGWRRWTTPFLWFGTNPLVAFVGSGMMARLIYSVLTVPGPEGPVPVQRVIFEWGFASWLAPRPASLCFAVTFVGCWALLLRALYRRRWFVAV